MKQEDMFENAEEMEKMIKDAQTKQRELSGEWDTDESGGGCCTIA